MNPLRVHVEGIGYWSSGLPGWQHAREYVRTGQLPDGTARRPSPELLAANERRRAPDSVVLALQVAQAACEDADRDAAQLPSVFASTHGDLAITDYMCATLATDPTAISPTRFHNSVHNAAAGYWTIGNRCMAPATAVSAMRATFAEGLLEAAAQALCDGGPVLLVAYDGEARGPLAAVSRSEGLLAFAMVLAARPGAHTRSLELLPAAGAADELDGPLARLHSGNAMAPMLPLVEGLATDGPGQCRLEAGSSAGRGRVLEAGIGAVSWA